jgi:hypothetical protein
MPHARIENHHRLIMDSITEGVIAKIRARATLGEKKYGVTMDRTDLTPLEWMEHFQQENMDASIYAEKWIRVNGTCKWGKINSACGEVIEVFRFEQEPRFDFCPFCGRKIEEVK